MAIDIYLGLDVGNVRTGVALARSDVRIAQPLTTLEHNDQVYDAVVALAAEHQATALVVGWPRGMQGQATDQTKYVEDFVEELRRHTELPIYMQDEALTSQKAEAELQARNQPFSKADVDSLAATYILDDYLTAPQTSTPGGAHV